MDSRSLSLFDATSVKRHIPTIPRVTKKLVAVTTIALVIFFLSVHAFVAGWKPMFGLRTQTPSQDAQKVQVELRCRDLPGANDTVVVMKTGCTELEDKLTVHLSTTMRCYPNSLIFSDYDEVYQNHTIIDALAAVSPNIRENHPDFHLYQRLQQGGGRAALDESELSGPGAQSHDIGGGKPQNPGWKLDKWKFLPMMERTYREYPDKKWYVFIESDTFIMWQTLLVYLSELDWTRNYYIGSQTEVDNGLFAHGGSAYLLSHPSLDKLVSQYTSAQSAWEDFTDEHWAGDFVLGQALLKSGTPLVWAWPIFQGDNPGEMAYNKSAYDHRLWCNPTISYHHVTPPVVESLWNFEMDWIASHHDDPKAFLKHQDVYEQYVLPQTANAKLEWDNHSDDDHGPVESIEACRTICEDLDSCVQYALAQLGAENEPSCLTTSTPNLGEARPGFQSGWLNDRMAEFHDRAEPCQWEGWIT